MLNTKPGITPQNVRYMRYLSTIGLMQQIQAHLIYGRPIMKDGRRLIDLEASMRAALDGDAQEDKVS
jgi:hypothetical protein